MKLNININDELLSKAREISGIKDENALIEKALQLFVTIEDQKNLIKLFGKVELDDEAFE